MAEDDKFCGYCGTRANGFATPASSSADAPPPVAAPSPPMAISPVPAAAGGRWWSKGRFAMAAGAVALVGAAVVAGTLLLGGGGDTNDGVTATVSASTATSAADSTLPTPHTAPPFPNEIQGYTRQSPPASVTFRVFTEQPNYIPDFPATMNGCKHAVITTRWRSLGGDVSAGNADPHLAGFPPPSAPRGAQVGQAGLVQGNQCEEPVFFLTAGPLGTLVDVSVQYQVWVASA